MTTGKVTSITTDWRGDTLASDVTPVGSALPVSDVTDFDENGGWLVVGDSAPMEYSGVDEDQEQVLLVGLAGDSYEAGLPVIVWDPSVGSSGAQVVEYVATVETETGPVDVILPHGLIPASGVDLLIGASVRTDQPADGDHYVGEVLGRDAQLVGGIVAMPISTAEDGKRVVITSEYNGAVLFYTGSDHEDPPDAGTGYLGGAGYITSSVTDLGSTVVLQTAIAGPTIEGAAEKPTIGLSSQDTSGTLTTYVTINAEKLVLNGDRVESPNMFVTAAPTTGGAANCNIGPGGQIRESTSSLRYKQDVESHEVDPAAVLRMESKTWRDRNAVAADPDTTERHVGFIAEDLDELGLTEFVTYRDGQPDAIQYDRLAVALLAVVQDQERRLTALENGA